MERFYRGLWEDGLGAAAALCRAQAAVRVASPAPCTWAAWVLAGEAW
jgi:CHAT domain-containing protein